MSTVTGRQADQLFEAVKNYIDRRLKALAQGSKRTLTTVKSHDAQGRIAQTEQVTVDDLGLALLEQRIARLEARPVLAYRSIWNESTTYHPDEIVTYRGSLWHCAADTQSKPGSDHAWRLMAKSGEVRKPRPQPGNGAST